MGDDFIKFETGNLAMINGGKNTGRVGVIISRERHQGSFDIVHLKDSAGHMFATRLGNVFVIGNGSTPMVSLPKRKGIKKSIIEEHAISGVMRRAARRNVRAGVSIGARCQTQMI